MPKKKEKKSDKQEENKKTVKKESPVDKPASEERERELYLIQIRYLNDQLERYQLRCDQLERQKTDLTSQLSSLEKEKKDVVGYLKRSVLKKEDEVDELTERLELQRQDTEKDREALQLQLGQLRQELQEKIEEVTAENRTLVSRLAGLEEFKMKKEQMMSDMASLEEQLTSEKEKHKAEIHSLEMKALLEKRRLEKEMESHKEAMSAEVEHLVEQKIPETTRSALQENEEVKARFGQLSELTQVLMQENFTLKDRKTRFRVDVEILEETLSETARQSCIRQRVVEQLTEKSQKLQVELKDCRDELDQLHSEHKEVLTERETLKLDLASLSELSRGNRAELSRLEKELQEERRRSSRMKSTMQGAALTLRQALGEMQTEQYSDLDTVVPLKQQMQNLLLVLNGPKHRDSPSDPAGDLGLIPGPTLKHNHIPSRSSRKTPPQKSSSATTNLNDSSVGSLTSTNTVIKSK